MLKHDYDYYEKYEFYFKRFLKDFLFFPFFCIKVLY